MQVVELAGYEEYAAVNDHVLLPVHLGRVPTSRQGRLIIPRYLRPSQRLQIELPSVIQFVVIVIFASEDVHAVAIHAIYFDNR